MAELITSYWIFTILIWIFLGYIGACIYDNDKFCGFCFGFLLGPLGWLICVCCESRDRRKKDEAKDTEHNKMLKSLEDEVKQLRKAESKQTVVRVTTEVKIVCPHCGQHLLIESPKHGETYECPICKSNICMV